MRVYLNGRVITDRSINHAMKEAYRGLIDPTRSPTVVLFMDMDPAFVDVNVHPAKAEVRFRNQSRIHGVVLAAVRGAPPLLGGPGLSTRRFAFRPLRAFNGLGFRWVAWGEE